MVGLPINFTKKWTSWEEALLFAPLLMDSFVEDVSRSIVVAINGLHLFKKLIE